jgi:hypothetical protein
VGPVLAGFLSDHIGDVNTLAFSGIFGMIAAVVLLKITPRHITVPKNLI